VIHESAVIDPSAVIGKDVTVGPWTTIGANVEIGDNCNIASHVVIKGPTVIGSGNTIYQFSSVGEDTPDLKYKGEPTRLVIGDNNTIREDNGETVIGSDNLFMAYVHVGHDCVIGNHVVMTNNAAVAGHVHVGDWSILSGFAMIHQYVSLGAHCFIGPAAFVYHDVPAYVTVSGSPAEPRTINREGLKRRNFSVEQIAMANKAYKILYRRGLRLEEAVRTIADLGDDPVITMFIDSVERSTRGIIR
jgi:UDP-N-acetylglucosamine acyltransferase